MDRPDCASKEPLIKLGEGGAPQLDYSLPQKTCLTLYGPMFVDVPSSWFKEPLHVAPKGNFWEWRDGALAAAAPDWNALAGEFRRRRTGTTRPTSSSGTTRPTSSDADTDEVAAAIRDGVLPIEKPTLWGRPRLSFMAKPEKAVPHLLVIEEYEVCSYLGNYGAGKTVATFSLLPGEKTTITMRSYRESTDSIARAESMLDSETEEASESFENTLQTEGGTSVGFEKSKGFDFSHSASVSVPTGYVDISGTDTVSYHSGSSQTREKYSKQITNSVAKHAQSVAGKREVQLSTSISQSTTTGSEETTARQLANINLSRVLNFVFRQLVQEYIVVVYLKNVRVRYSNGYPESERLIDLPELKDFLEAAMTTSEHAREALQRILRPYCRVLNHRGEAKRFIEEVKVELGDCPFPAETVTETYFRKAVDVTDREDNIVVDGVILSVSRHMMPTDSVISEALLGQGEALDCYNQSLQYAAVQKADLENRLADDALTALKTIPDPVERGRAYMKQTHGCCEEEPTES